MRGFGVLDRAVVREVVTPAMLGFVVYTFLLLMRGIFTLMEQIFVRGVQWMDAIRILGATIPNVIVLTIPMSFLFGVLLGVGRMNADNEMIALQAGGISARRVLRPILGLGIVLAGLNLYLFVDVIPDTNRRLRQLKVELYTSATNIGRIEPKVFVEDLSNLLLYVREVDPETGVWRRVMVYDTSDPSEERLTLADRGRMVSTIDDADGLAGKVAASSTPWLLLEDVVTHQFFRLRPEKYRVNNTPRQLIRPGSEDRGVVRVNLGVRERTTDELLQASRTGDFGGPEQAVADGKERAMLQREAALELHRRLAIPMACVVFALLAVPLGIGSRAGGRGRGFIISLGVVVLYYILSNHGELLAQEGRIEPWLGMWSANIVLTLAALVMMRRMGYWIGERGGSDNFVARIWQRWRRWRLDHGERADLGERPPTGSIPIAVQRRRYSAGFPTMLDRYVTRRLLSPIFMVLLSTLLLYVVIDVTDHIDDMAKHRAPAEVILTYYWNLLPQAVMDVLPFALMIGLLILLTVLERQRELTAIKAAGISLYRLILPAMLIGMAGVAVMWALGESVVPEANAESKRMLDRIRGRETARSYRVSDRQWLVSRDEGTFYNFMQYDPAEETLLRFTMFRLDESSRLSFHLVAPRLRYREGVWTADGGWYRTFGPNGAEHFERVSSSMEVPIPEGPSYFGQEYRRPAEMSYRELGAYIRALEESGYEPGMLRVRWHQKFSYPVSALVMVMLALPFGLNRGGGRVTTMQGVALALGLGIGYFLFVALFGKMGEAGLLPPALGAWAPVALAVLFSLNRFTTLRT